MPPEVAEIDVAIIRENNPNFSYANHMMLLSLDLPMRNFN